MSIYKYKLRYNNEEYEEKPIKFILFARREELNEFIQKLLKDKDIIWMKTNYYKHGYDKYGEEVESPSTFPKTQYSAEIKNVGEFFGKQIKLKGDAILNDKINNLIEDRIKKQYCKKNK